LKPYADALALRLDREAPMIAKQKNDTSETHDGDMKGQAPASSRKSGARRPADH